MTGFTLIAVGIFLATVIHQIVANPVITTLPNIWDPRRPVIS